jgi:hypothetical protein
VILIALGWGIVALAYSWAHAGSPPEDDHGANIGLGFVWLAGLAIEFAGGCAVVFGLVMWVLQLRSQGKTRS